MSVARVRNKRSLAFTIAFAMLLALAVPFAGIALADTDNTSPDLQALNNDGAETETNAAGSLHTVYANVVAGTEVDFEIDCTSDCAGASYTISGTGGSTNVNQNGGPVNAVDSPTDGDQTPETADDTRATPEMSCLATASGGSGGAAGCSVTYSRADNGTDLVAAWADNNTTNEANDSDTAEGRDEATAPGNITEVDDTDIVQKTWFTATQANVFLDCDDNDDTDTETNPPNESEVYTCRAFNNAGTTGTPGDDTVVSGVVIDAENIYTVQGANGANDPDNSGADGTADFNNACTTGADGTCTFTLAAGEGETGSADVCFWIDEDNDTEFAPAGSNSFDGAACDTESATGDEATTDDDTNRQDVVRKTWATPTATTLDAEPERDANLKGTSHTVTATVMSQFGTGLANISVDFVVTGANVGAGCQNVLTNGSGVATCTYTDSTTIVGAEPETDTIAVSVDGSAATDASVDENDADLADNVEKFWFTTFPTAGSVIVDMVTTTQVAAQCNQAADSSDSAVVESNNDLCGTVYAGPGATNPIQGQNVTLTVDGGSSFVNEGTTTGNTGTDRADDTDLGQTITVTTDADGVWRATLTSLEAGSDTVTATAGSATDTGTKTWTALANARTLDCSPETATNPPGTEHLITCTALDRLGNPVAEAVDGSESGPGRFVGNSTVTTNATTGEAEFVVQTTAGEEGTQTITFALDDDDDDTTPLDDTNNVEGDTDECDAEAGLDPDGTTARTDAPEGVCADEVTKTWTEETPVGDTECNDGVDNDNDGNIDFPDDAGCSSAEDDSEISETPRPCRNRTGGENVIVGTSGADVLTGTPENDIICGAGGDDVISAKGGADLVVGNGGDDNIRGGGGKDNLSGNGGNDTVSGNRGNDAIKGQAGNDTLKGNNGIDSLTGGKGADSLQGGDKGDILKGGAGNDSLRGGKGRDLLDGGDGNDGCFGGPGRDRIKNCE